MLGCSVQVANISLPGLSQQQLVIVCLFFSTLLWPIVSKGNKTVKSLPISPIGDASMPFPYFYPKLNSYVLDRR